MQLRCRNHLLDMGRPQVMGVLNVTPDSFSDGGRYLEPAAAEDRARQMLEEGATLIDIGGESTRPGAAPVEASAELARVLPIIERVARLDVVVSIDTSKPVVMREACAAGAGLINDVRALREPGAMEAARATGAAICLMHMQGEPRTMQQAPDYADVVAEVGDFLAGRLQACVEAGVPAAQILLDPGFGFGKSLAHNLRLLAHLSGLRGLGCPLLVGISRKSMLGAVTGLPPEQRIHAGLAAAVLAAWQGASIVRTHDVRATVEALELVASTLQYQTGKQ